MQTNNHPTTPKNKNREGAALSLPELSRRASGKDKQRGAVLAGLRLLQEALNQGRVIPNVGHIGNILTNCGLHEGMTANEIDGLCEAINQADETDQSESATALQRDFHGFRQYRDDVKSPWRFYITGFDATSSGQAGFCTVMLSDGNRDSSVPIDAQDRITINGLKYGPENWIH